MKPKKYIKYKTTKKITKSVIQTILNIEKQKGLTAGAVLEHAKQKSSPLNKFFEWNNTDASKKWREHQARGLINEIKIIVEDVEVYAFENVNINVNNVENANERMYKPIKEIMSSKDLKNQMLKSALEHIEYWENKYRGYTELNPIFKSIEKVKKSQKQKWQKQKQK